MPDKPKAKAEPTAIEIAEAEQARVESAVKIVAPKPAELEQDPQQAAVDAAIAELRAGSES